MVSVTVHDTVQGSMGSVTAIAESSTVPRISLRRALNERRSLGIRYQSWKQDMRVELLVLHRVAEGTSGGIQQGVE